MQMILTDSRSFNGESDPGICGISRNVITDLAMNGPAGFGIAGGAYIRMWRLAVHLQPGSRIYYRICGHSFSALSSRSRYFCRNSARRRELASAGAGLSVTAKLCNLYSEPFQESWLFFYQWSVYHSPFLKCDPGGY